MVNRVREAGEACFEGHKCDCSASARTVASKSELALKTRPSQLAGTSEDRARIPHPERQL
jgi:hypothetical protein